MSRKSSSDRDPYFEAFRAAGARRKAALTAIKRAKRETRQLDAALLEQLSAAEQEEFQALAALLAKPRRPLGV